MMNDSLQFVLFADLEEILGGLVGLVALVLWVLKQISEAGKQVQQPPRGGPQPVPQPMPPQGGAAARGQQADPLRNQVEEFLRRAGRGPQANQPRAGGANEIDVLVDEEPRPERRPLAEPLRTIESRPAAAQQQAATPRPITAQKLEQGQPRRSVVPRKRKTLTERAAEREGERARKLAEHAAQLGQRIVAEDAQFDVQLKAKFDHAVGTLTGSAVAEAEQAAMAARMTTTPAAQIAAMLASPDGVRQAIVINEILRRPIDRW